MVMGDGLVQDFDRNPCFLYTSCKYRRDTIHTGYNTAKQPTLQMISNKEIGITLPTEMSLAMLKTDGCQTAGDLTGASGSQVSGLKLCLRVWYGGEGLRGQGGE